MKHSAMGIIHSEFAHLIDSQAARIQCADLETLAAKLPAMRARFSKMTSWDYPDLPDQLEFLALVIEDSAAGLSERVPRAALAEAAFALAYCDSEHDLIPDHLPGIGLLDDATIVNLVLQRNEHAYRENPRAYKLKWPVPPMRFEAAFARSIHSHSLSCVHLPIE